MNLEEAAPDVVAGPIVDLCITYGSDQPPPGYYRISKTSSGRFADLSYQSDSKGPSSIFLNVKKESTGNWESAVQRPWVVAIAIIFPDRNEFVPPGFYVVKRYKTAKNANTKEGVASKANLNEGTTRGERVYLCCKRSREGNPIVGILPLLPSEMECIPDGYTVIEKSPRNYAANINEGAGPPIFLAVRQRLSNLEILRPLPLLQFQVSKDQESPSKRNRMHGYYATGGTVVPSSKVGLLHIMDRMGHHYLSPSSMATRMSLAYDSPAKGEFTPVYQNWLKKVQQDHVQRQPALQSKASTVSCASLSSSIIELQIASHGGDIDSKVSSGHISSKKFSKLLQEHHQPQYLWTDADSTVRGSTSSSFELNADLNQSMSQLTQDGESYSYDCDTSPLGSTARKPPFPTDYKIPTTYPELINACQDSMNFIPVIIGHYSDVSEGGKMNVDRRVSVLTPILTACYTYHGGTQLLALEGLIYLLGETDFFLPDVTNEQMKQKHSLLNPNQTLLDLAIQVVCDVATCSSREIYFHSCVDFCAGALRFAVQHGGSVTYLHTRSLGYILRLYTFVCHFGATLPNTKLKKDGHNTDTWALNVADDDVDLLIPNYHSFLQAMDKNRTMDPGDVAAVALQEMISFVVKDLGNCKSSCNSSGGDELDDTETFMKFLVSDVVDSAVDRVNISNLMQLTANQIHRGGGSVSESSRWPVQIRPARWRSSFQLSDSLTFNCFRLHCSGTFLVRHDHFSRNNSFRQLESLFHQRICMLLFALGVLGKGE